MSRILQWLLLRRVHVPSGSACVARTISSASTQKSTMGTPPKSSVRRVHRLRCQQIPIRQPCVEKQISGVCIHFGWGASRSNSAALRRKEISGVSFIVAAFPLIVPYTMQTSSQPFQTCGTSLGHFRRYSILNACSKIDMRYEIVLLTPKARLCIAPQCEHLEEKSVVECALPLYRQLHNSGPIPRFAKRLVRNPTKTMGAVGQRQIASIVIE